MTIFGNNSIDSVRLLMLGSCCSVQSPATYSVKSWVGVPEVYWYYELASTFLFHSTELGPHRILHMRSILSKPTDAVRFLMFSGCLPSLQLWCGEPDQLPSMISSAQIVTCLWHPLGAGTCACLVPSGNPTRALWSLLRLEEVPWLWPNLF